MRIRALLAGGLGEALALFVTLRIALSLFAVMASLLFPLPGPCTWENGPLLHATGLSFRLLGVWQRWDACWYLKIATLGYRPEDSSVVFFPLYPLLERLIGLPFAGNFLLGGLVVSGVAYVAAITGLYQLVQLDFDEPTAQRTTLYLSIFPAAFFLFAPFTEALFLGLSVWTLYSARRGQWWWAALTALLVGLTRTQGCLLALPLAWEFLRQWRRETSAAPRPHLAGALVGLLPIASFMLFIAYTSVATGWTAFQAQQGWGLTSRPPWDAIATSWQHIRTRGDVVEALNLAGLVFSAVILLVGVRRMPFTYTLYAAPQLLLIASRVNSYSPLMATLRYVQVLFPIFVVLAILGRHHRLHHAWLILSLLLLGFLFFGFLSGPFVG